MPKDFKGGVRVARIQIDRKSLTADTLQQWREISEACRDMTNTICNQWMLWHEQCGSFGLLKQWRNELATWHKQEGKKGSKPKCPVDCWPSEFSRILNKLLGERFPGVHERVRSLLLQKTKKSLTTKRAAKGSMSAWIDILCGREHLPGTTRLQPIPIDNRNCGLGLWHEDGGEWNISVRIDRTDDAKSTLAEFSLFTKSRRAASQRAIFERIVAGEYKFCGSSIQYRESERKWYLLLAYQLPKDEKAKVDARRTAVLSAAEDHPWSLSYKDDCNWLIGQGRFIAPTRAKLFRQRRERSQAYRHAGSSNKGHGRDRAIRPLDVLSARWKQFVKLTNDVCTSRAVDYCIKNGIGKLVYEQPVDSFRDSRFLFTAGRSSDSKSSGWDWHQVATMLEYKTQAVGIKLEIAQVGGSVEESAA